MLPGCKTTPRAPSNRRSDESLASGLGKSHLTKDRGINGIRGKLTRLDDRLKTVHFCLRNHLPWQGLDVYSHGMGSARIAA